MDRFRCRTLANPAWILLWAHWTTVIGAMQWANPAAIPQICSKLQSMLSFGKYETYQISSNITYVPRVYAQNFLAYSSIDDLLLFIEPKHQIHVYDAQSVQLIVNISTTDVITAASCTSLISESPHELFFIYANHSSSNLIALRVCQVRFDSHLSSFEQSYCIEPVKLQYDHPNLRIYGFTIKRDHAGTKKSLLFVSTEIGVIYAVFDTSTGALVREPAVLNATLNEGSVVLSSSNSIYYASKQEHLIYELRVSNDFHLSYGRVTRSKSIKSPFGLVADECHHLYIATRSMILIMYTQESVTIRSVFSKASDLPITLERLNATTYVYATVNKNAKKTQPHWMFNFLYFTEPEKNHPLTRHPVINMEEPPPVNLTTIDSAQIPKLWPLSKTLVSTTDTSRVYTQFFSVPRKPFALFRRRRLKKPSTTDRGNATARWPYDEQLHDLDDFLEHDDDDDDDDDDDLQSGSQESIDSALHRGNQSESGSTTDTDSAPRGRPNRKTSQRGNQTSTIDDHLSDSDESSDRSASHLLQTTLPTTSNTDDDLPFLDEEFLRDYLANHPITDVELLPETAHPLEFAPTRDELRAYFEDRSVLSRDQIAHIQAYLVARLSANAKHLTTTENPDTSQTHTGVTQSLPSIATARTDNDSQEASPPEQNRTAMPDEMLFAPEELEAYFQGDPNLPPEIHAHIEAYLAKQPSLDRTAPVTGTTTATSTTELDDGEHVALDDILGILPQTDSKYYNFSTSAEEVLISQEELRAYMEGHANLSDTQHAQFQAYLAKQPRSDQDLFRKYFATTTKASPHSKTPSTSPRAESTASTIEEEESEEQQESLSTSPPRFPADNLQEDVNRSTHSPHAHTEQPIAHITTTTTTTAASTRVPPAHEDAELEELLDTMPWTDSGETEISKDEMRAFLQGRDQIPQELRERIEAYLVKVPPSLLSILTRYATTTTTTTTARTDLFVQDTSRDEGSSAEMLPSILEHFNRTADTVTTPFTIDELRAYLQGRSDLPSIRQEQIREYLDRESSSIQQIFSEQARSTRRSSTTTTVATTSDDVLGKLPRTDSNHFNLSIGSEQVLISVDDFRAYLQGRGNLSAIQRAQVQAFLDQQSPSDQEMFAGYSASTVAPRTSSPTDERPEQYPPGLLSSLLQHFNRSTDPESVSFTVDELRSYLQGHTNLSRSQQQHIQQYLDSEAPSIQQIFSDYEKTSKAPTTPASVTPDAEQKLDELLAKLPTIIVGHANTSTDSEQLGISRDDLLAYLQGRGNLSREQQAQIQTLIDQQPSANRDAFAELFTSTKKPVTTSPTSKERPSSEEDGRSTPESSLPDGNLFSSDDLQSYLRGDTDLSPEKQAHIEAYLGNQSVRNRTPSTTQRSSTDDHSARLKELLSKIPQADIGLLNLTTDSGEILISDEEIQSFIEGRSNLSTAQQAYLRAQLTAILPEDQNPFLKDSTTSTPGQDLHPHSEPSEDHKPPSHDLASTNRTSHTGNVTFRTGDQTAHTHSPDAQTSPSTGTQAAHDAAELDELLERLPWTGSEETEINKDDLRSYLQGRSNLTRTQEAQLQAYLEKQPLSDQALVSKYRTSSTTPSSSTTPRIDVEQLFQQAGNQSFTIDELRSYLQDRANLSSHQQTVIAAYVAGQLALNQTVLSKLSSTTAMPSEGQHHDDGGEANELDEFMHQLSIANSTASNLTQDSAQPTGISKGNLLAYLQGRGNLSSTQEAEIRTFLAKQPLVNQTRLVQYLSSTQSPTGQRGPQSMNTSLEVISVLLDHVNRSATFENASFTIDELRSYLQGSTNLSSSQQEQIKVYLNQHASTTPSTTTRPAIDELLNKLPVIDSEHGSISRDDLQLHLQGRGNLTRTQQEQIQAYLNQLPASDRSLLSQYLASTTTAPSSTIDLELVLQQLNRTTDSAGTPFTVDELRSYLQHTGNLSLVRHEEIQRHLANQSSDLQRLLTSYSTTRSPDQHDGQRLLDLLQKIHANDTKQYNLSTITGQTLISRDDLESYLHGRGNLSSAQTAQIEAYLAQHSSSSQPASTSTTTAVPPSRSTSTASSKPTTAFEESLFFFDELRAYLQGRRNLSPAKIARFQAYLAKQAANNQSIWSAVTTSARTSSTVTTTLSTAHEEGNRTQDAHLDELLKSIPLADVQHYNLSVGSEEARIDKDDLRAYLEGRRNLTQIQEAQFRAYLAKQPPSQQQMFSKFLDGRGTDAENDSSELLPLDLDYLNRTIGLDNLLFTLDDLRSYLRGGGHLTPAQIAQIRAYLAGQQALNRRTTTTTTTTTGDGLTTEENFTTGEQDLEDFLANIRPLVNSTSANASHDSPEPFFSADIIRAYLQGRANLTKEQEEKLRSFLNKYSSLTNSTFNTSHTISPFAHRPRTPSSTPAPMSTLDSSSELLSEKTTTTKTAAKSTTSSPSRTRGGSKTSAAHSLSTEVPQSTSSAPSSLSTAQASATSDRSKTSSSKTNRPRGKSKTSTSSSRSPKQQSTKAPLDDSTSKPSETSTQPSSTPRSIEPVFASERSTLIPSTLTMLPDRSSASDIVRPVTYPSPESPVRWPLPSTYSPWWTSRYREDFIPDRSTPVPYFDAFSTIGGEDGLSTTFRRFRNRKQKIVRWQTSATLSTLSSSSLSSSAAAAEDVPKTEPAMTGDNSTSLSTSTSWFSQLNPSDPQQQQQQQQSIVIKPVPSPDDADRLLANEYLNRIFDNISNSSANRSIYLNLRDYPASSWNFSVRTNDSVILNVALPPPSNSSSVPTGRTNLTFTSIDADRFATNIIGKPIRLQVDRVHANEFSLTMNSTDDEIDASRRGQHVSDVTIGHVTSEHFRLNLSQSDTTHVHVRQVNSATAELYLDERFCTNESSLDINLNLSKNGTIRYGNRTPIHVGPVFTRVHLLKESCSSDQPLSLFFDVCKQANPCQNNGTCISLQPDYNSTSYTSANTGDIGYRCHCPPHTRGEHCEVVSRRYGQCLNGGTFIQIYDRNNQSIEKCLCTADHVGRHCEETIDNCVGVTCSDRGVCVDDVQSYRCACFEGYHGSSCERTRTPIVILKVVNRSFGIVAGVIILIIGCLVVASDIHTCWIRKRQQRSGLAHLPHVASDPEEGAGEQAPIELKNVPVVGQMRRMRGSRLLGKSGHLSIANRTPVSKPSDEPELLSVQPL